MNRAARQRAAGFTLIELLSALLVLSLLAVMSYRGLGAVLDTREHVKLEAEKWRHAGAFFARMERDMRLAAPRAVRTNSRLAAAWLGRADATQAPMLEFSRFGALEGVDNARRVGYRLNERHQIELWIWPGLDVAPGAVPTRYPVLDGVTRFEAQYLNAGLAWQNAWPTAPADAPIPLAIRVRIVLASGEELVRVFALTS